MGKAQLFYHPLLGRIYMAPVFSSAAVESFGAKSLHLTGAPLNLNFHFSQHSSWSCLDFLVFEGIRNCFIMHYILRTPSLEKCTLHRNKLWALYTERMEGIESAVGWSGWAQGTRSHPQTYWAPHLHKPCCDSQRCLLLECYLLFLWC